METIRTVYLGDLRTQATHVGSGYQLITDVPKEHGGKGESFSPTDLFCASIVSSMLSVMGGVAKDPAFGGTILGTQIRTTKIMKQSPHMVAEIIIEFDMPKNNFTDEQKKKLETSVRNSQVGRSLHADLKQTVIFNY
jgi:putative redox protein